MTTMVTTMMTSQTQEVIQPYELRRHRILGTCRAPLVGVPIGSPLKIEPSDISATAVPIGLKGEATDGGSH